jgi:hypothetical protein
MTENAPEATVEQPEATVTQLPFQTPEFNMAEEVIADLAEQNAQQARQIAILKANVKQLNGIIKANKDVLGLEEDEQGNLRPAAPKPIVNRAARRARPTKK